MRCSDRIGTSLNVLGDSFCHLAYHGAAPSSVYVSYRSVSLCVRYSDRIRTSLNVLGYAFCDPGSPRGSTV